MTLSVIVVTYNIREMTRQCLRAVENAHYRGDVEIIVVDNASHDGSADAVERDFPGVQVIRNESNLGFAVALNIGLAAATGEHVLSLNPDTIIEESTLQVLSDYLRDTPEVGCVGPKILNSDGTYQRASKRSFPTPWIALTGLLGLGRLFPGSKRFGRYNLTYLDPDETHLVDAVSGSCMMLTREALRQVGSMDENLFLGGDDLDYCYRLHKAGFAVAYHPATQIIHYKGETRRAAPYYNLRLHFEAMAIFADKHREMTGGPLSRAVIRLGIMLAALLSYVRTYLATIASFLIDVLVIGAAFFTMIALRFLPDPDFRTSQMLLKYAPVVAVYALLWVGIGGLMQIYGRYVLNYSRALIASVIGFFVIATGTYIYQEIAYSRIVLVSASAVVGLLLPGWRLLVHIRQASHKMGDSYRTQRPSVFSRRAIVLGAGEEGQRIAALLLKRPDIGIDLLGFVDDNPPAHIDAGMPPVLGTVTQINDLYNIHRFQEVIVAQGSFATHEIMAVLEQTRHLRLLFRMVPHEDEVMLGKANIEFIGPLPFVNVEATLYHRFHLFSKRAFDLLASGLAIVALLPLWPLLMAFYGLQKQRIWTVGGDQTDVWLLRNGGNGVRRLPLLWAIFRGRLSFVGGEVIPAEQSDPELLFKPGMTGLTQLRRYSSMDGVSRSYQHYYLQHQSLTFDLEVILKTLLRI